MRILAGTMRGRGFEQPATRSVRPLSDKARAAIFDVVGAPEGFAVLDAYAGSGAAGFEALSRGAAMVDAIEASSSVARVIERNAAALGLSWGYVLHVMTAEKWLALPVNQPDADRPQARYHLIIADPPYAQLDADVLARFGPFVLPGGVLVVSHSSKHQPPQLESLRLARHKVYGDTALSFYQVA
ncbi:MAG TPA: RsmD family RNA methyltransferase [Candidatus Saccharimonas sp.]|nr:RsmD family RNA methyltransferase [Candidatus Saccharimonas sp.]